MIDNEFMEICVWIDLLIRNDEEKTKDQNILAQLKNTESFPLLMIKNILKQRIIIVVIHITNNMNADLEDQMIVDHQQVVINDHVQIIDSQNQLQEDTKNQTIEDRYQIDIKEKDQMTADHHQVDTNEIDLTTDLQNLHHLEGWVNRDIDKTKYKKDGNCRLFLIASYLLINFPKSTISKCSI
jgi:hypothetical protein